MKQLRTSRGISQKQLACAVGVSQQSINKYENHNIEPDIATLIRIADYFNTSVDYLIDRPNVPDEGELQIACGLTLEEASFLHKYRRLNLRQRHSLELVVDNYMEKQTG